MSEEKKDQNQEKEVETKKPKRRGRPKKVKETKKEETKNVEETKKEETTPTIVDDFSEAGPIGVIEEEVDTNGKEIADVLRGEIKDSETVKEEIEEKEEETEKVSEEMNQELFESLISKFEKFKITQNDVVIANSSKYLQISTDKNGFKLFNKQYSYKNVKVIKK